MSSLPQTPAGRLLGALFEAPETGAATPRMPSDSRGRFWPEDESPTRTCYQRDRDRIIHSTAFRRLKHKTQVFVQHEGDYYRTRLTHSLEVSQIARSVSRVLGLDEDLAEASRCRTISGIRRSAMRARRRSIVAWRGSAASITTRKRSRW